MPFVINPAKWKKLTLSIVAAIVAGSLAAQTQWVQSHIDPLLAAHPHWAWIGGALISILQVIHDPRARTIVTQILQEQQETNPATGTVTSTTTSVEVAKPTQE